MTLVVALVAGIAFVAGGSAPSPQTLGLVEGFSPIEPAEAAVTEIILGDDVPDGDFRVFVAGQWTDVVNGSSSVVTLYDAPTLTVVVDEAGDLALSAITIRFREADPAPVIVDWYSTAFVYLISTPEFVSSDPVVLGVLRGLAERSAAFGDLARALRDGDDPTEPLVRLAADIVEDAYTLAADSGDLGFTTSSMFHHTGTASYINTSTTRASCAHPRVLDDYGQCFDVTNVGARRDTATIRATNYVGSWIAFTERYEDQTGFVLPIALVPPITHGGVTATRVIRTVVDNVVGGVTWLVCAGWRRSGSWCSTRTNERIEEMIGWNIRWTNAGTTYISTSAPLAPRMGAMHTVGRRSVASADRHLSCQPTQALLWVLTAWSYVVSPAIQLATSVTALDHEPDVTLFEGVMDAMAVAAFPAARLAGGDFTANIRAVGDWIVSNPLVLGEIARAMLFPHDDPLELASRLLAAGLTTAAVRAIPIVGWIVGAADLVTIGAGTGQQLSELTRAIASLPPVRSAPIKWSYVMNDHSDVAEGVWSDQDPASMSFAEWVDQHGAPGCLHFESILEITTSPHIFGTVLRVSTDGRISGSVWFDPPESPRTVFSGRFIPVGPTPDGGFRVEFGSLDWSLPLGPHPRLDLGDYRDLLLNTRSTHVLYPPGHPGHQHNANHPRWHLVASEGTWIDLHDWGNPRNVSTQYFNTLGGSAQPEHC